MTDIIDQLRRLVDAREKATKGDWYDAGDFISACGSTDFAALSKRMEKMEAALRFYADTENHTIHIIDEVPYHYVDDDGGQRAREALE